MTIYTGFLLMFRSSGARHRQSKLPSRLARLVVNGCLGCFVLIGAPAQIFGQINVNSNPGTGNWNAAGTWNGGVVPHNGINRFNAFVGGSSTVNLTTSHSVNQLNVDGVVNFLNQTLTISKNSDAGSGVINNNGNMNLTSTGGNATLLFSGNVLGDSAVQINGTGVINLNGTGSTARIIGSNVLTHGSGHTIQGSGNVGSGQLNITNQGTIRALSGHNLIINPFNGGNLVTFNNTGTVSVLSGGSITFVGDGGDFGGNGTYAVAPGGQFILEQNANFRNMTFNGSGDVIVGSGGNALWQNVTHHSNTMVPDSRILNLTTSVTNTGNIDLASLNGAVTTRMTIRDNTSLSGGGTIRLLGPNALIAGDSIGTFTNVDNTISGNGRLGLNSLAIVNQGTIQAGAGQTMTIDPRPGAAQNTVTFSNNGLVRAHSGGQIVLIGTAGAIGGSGTYRAEANSIISFADNSRVFGGCYETVGNGRIINGSNTNWAGISNKGMLEVANGTTTTVSGPITNDGNIQVTSTGSPTNVSVEGNQTVSGTGSVTMTGGNSNITGTGSLTNGGGHTITGGGSIGSNTLAITNAGTISNSPGNTFAIRGDMHLADGGRIASTSSPGSSFVFHRPLTQTGGLFYVQQNSTVSINSTYVQSGGRTVMQGGTLVLGQDAGFLTGGWLQGNGTLRGNYNFFGLGRMAPGFSPGELEFDGDLSWGDGGVVEFDLGADAASSDLISISGDLLKDGAGTYAFNFVNNGWVVGQTYDLMGFDSTVFSVGDFSYSNGGGFAGDFAISGGSMLQFTVTAIPKACDFSADGLCDVIDIDLMQSLGPIAVGIPATGNVAFDLNSDGAINLVDRDAWLAAAATENGLNSPYKLGDGNLDGVVDGSDFGLWNANKFTSTRKWSEGDFSADNVNDGSDFGLWNANKFTSSDITAIPEPLSATVAWAALVLLGVTRRRG